MTARRVGIHPSLREVSWSIWDALEHLVHVQFCHDPESAAYHSADALIVSSLAESEEAAPGTPCFVTPKPLTGSETTSGQIRFASDSCLDPRLAGRRLSHNAFNHAAPVQADAGDVTLATCGDLTVWLRRHRSDRTLEIVTAPLPLLAESEKPFDYLNGGHFIQLVPLLHFLRELAGDTNWRPPPVRACLMFDDPNLHRPSYGFLPFREVAARASSANYHVACATVPLDCWYANAEAVRLFRRHADRLSLLMHGNDHLRGELGLDLSEEAGAQLLAQALRRVAAMEKRTGVRVARVMAPPHGATRPQILGSMCRLGYKGACVSPWSLRDWAPDREWPTVFGLEVAEIVDERFPIAPRFRLHEGCEGWVVIYSFMDRPVVPVGHHSDLKTGLELLEVVAGYINALPEVQWSDLEGIFDGSFSQRVSGSQCWIRPHCTQFEAVAPEGVDSVTITSANDTGMRQSWTVTDSTNSLRTVIEDTPFSARPGTRIHAQLQVWRSLSPESVPNPRFSPWAPVRRLLCEGRDRVLPLLRGR